jgi:hypothetical protein
VDVHVLETITAVLSAEEKALGLSQPHGVGQRPRQVPNDTIVLQK